jgi:hypothetical protein
MSDDKSLTDPYNGELPADPDLAPAKDDTKDDAEGGAADDIADALPGSGSARGLRVDGEAPLP